MKNIVLYLFISSILFISCEKDSMVTITDTKTLKQRSTDIILEGKGKLNNGMLEFYSYTDFIEIINKLKLMSNDSNFVKQAYTELGYNSKFDDDSSQITSFPVLEKFERSISFLSARKVEETEFWTFLNNGGDPSKYDNEHFISNPFLKCLLNSDNEIKIGTRIFKFLDIDHTIIVGNSDFNLFNQIRELSYNKIVAQENLMKIKTSSFDEKTFFNFNSTNEKTGLKSIKNLDVGYIYINDSTVEFTNRSFIDNGNWNIDREYKWKFGNGDEYIGVKPPNIVLSEGDSTNVIIDVTDSEGETISDTLDYRGQCYITFPDQTEALSVKNMTAYFDFPNHLIIDIFGGLPKNLKYKWDFGDGTPVKFGNPISHTYQEEGVYRVTLTILYTITVCNPDIGCWDEWYTYKCQFLFRIEVPKIKCDDKGSNTNSATKNINGKIWKLTGKIWTKKTFPILGGFEVGASSRTFKKGSWWTQKKVDDIWVFSEGWFYENIPNYCEKKYVYPWWEHETNSNYVSNDINANDVGYEPYKYKSRHKAKQSGVKWEIPGYLYLY